MLGFSPARVGAVAALATAFSLVVVPLPAALPSAVPSALASATPSITTVPSVTHVGAVLQIAGSGLEDASSLSLNGTALSALQLIDGSHLSATVPSGATSGTLTVTTSSGGSGTSPDTVTVSPPPAPVTGVSTDVVYRAATLSWSGDGTGTAIVRDVTGLTAPWAPTSGRGIPVSAGAARDNAFTNTVTRDYAIWSTDADGTPSDSPTSASVSPVPGVGTGLSLTTSFVSAPYGQSLTLRGSLTRAGLPMGGSAVYLYGATIGSAPAYLRHLTTASDGTFSTGIRPARSSHYSVRFAGDAFSSPSVSPERTVTVLPRLSAGFTPNTILRGGSTALHGQLLPPVAGVVLTVQRRVGTSWVAFTHVRTGSYGSYSISLSPPVGVQVVRVLFPGVVGLSPAASAPTSLRVDPRNLSDGMSGPDVVAVQRRLTALHYDTGAINGVYGYSTHHAVMAFQKVERLAVTGFWGSPERLRSTRPTAWHVRFPGRGRAVEIDITRQVLVLSEQGVVRRIIDVSTGSGKVYYQDGVRNVAHTPRGHYSIYYKIDGIRISKLGALYKPSYFFQGYAVHGSASVPSFPASHGCVRITNPNADRLFPLLTVHTPVTLYDE